MVLLSWCVLPGLGTWCGRRNQRTAEQLAHRLQAIGTWLMFKSPFPRTLSGFFRGSPLNPSTITHLTRSHACFRGLFVVPRPSMPVLQPTASYYRRCLFCPQLTFLPQIRPRVPGSATAFHSQRHLCGSCQPRSSSPPCLSWCLQAERHNLGPLDSSGCANYSSVSS